MIYLINRGHEQSGLQYIFVDNSGSFSNLARQFVANYSSGALNGNVSCASHGCGWHRDSELYSRIQCRQSVHHKQNPAGRHIFGDGTFFAIVRADQKFKPERKTYRTAHRVGFLRRFTALLCFGLFCHDYFVFAVIGYRSHLT